MNRPENQILIIFGASGDLAKRKLIPALFELYSRKLMPEKFAVVGAARTAYSDAEYRKYQAENIIKYGKDRIRTPPCSTNSSRTSTTRASTRPTPPSTAHSPKRSPK